MGVPTTVKGELVRGRSPLPRAPISSQQLPPQRRLGSFIGVDRAAEQTPMTGIRRSGFSGRAIAGDSARHQAR